MSLDQSLAETLRRTAEEHDPPFPDLSSIVEGGRRRKRRRDVRRLSIVTACAAVAVAIPFAVRPFATDSTAPTGETDAPYSVGELSVGAEPATPYCALDGTVHQGRHVIDTRCSELITRGSTTIRMTPRGVERLVGGKIVLLDRRWPESWFPGMSNDGRWVAWVTDDTPDEEQVLLAFDLRKGTHLEVPWLPLSGWVPGVDDLGRAYFQDHTDGTVTLHDLRTGETVEVSGLPEHGATSVEFVTADGLGVTTNPRPIELVVGSVSADGRFTPTRAVTRGWSHYSPDRSRVVFERDGDLVIGDASDNGDVVPLLLPQSGAPVWYPVWETDDTVLVQFDPYSADTGLDPGNGRDVPASRTFLLRCSADDGSCEIAVEDGWGSGIDYPVYR